MHPAPLTRAQRLRILAVLAATQLLGWGAVGILPVLAVRIAPDIGLTLPAAFAGASTMFVAMGLAAPLAGRAFRAFGPRRVMACGSLLAAGGLGLLAAAEGAGGYYLAWGILGIAGAALLTTAAYVYLSDLAGTGARTLIGTLMLATGLATTLFWPVTALLDGVLGWRGAVLAYAAALAALVPAAILLGLPEPARPAGTVPGSAVRRPTLRAAFWLIVLAISINGFVTFGIEAMAIEILKALGADTVRAVALASLIGLFKVGGRLIDVAGGKRWDGLTTALVAGCMMPAGLAVLGSGGVAPWAIAGFLVLFGVGSGAYAVARATMPLAFFRDGEYSRAAAAIALPLNLIVALAPPALAWLLRTLGAVTVMWSLAACGLAALAAIVALTQMRQVAPGA